jgi:nucleoside 2-deoxyribosyltransferase
MPSSPFSPAQVAMSDEVQARIAENKMRALAIFEQRKKAAEEKKRQEDSQKTREISKILIDDDDF